MKNINKLKINENDSVKKALSIINNGTIKMAFVVNKKDKLVGTLSDGDIRRGLLRGININSSIFSIINKKPLVGKDTETKEKLFRIAKIKKINQIPIINNKGKVIDILPFNYFNEEKLRVNKIVIMAGGRGRRLMPLTKDTPKPMLKVKNKPILQNIIENFKNCGFKDFIICVNYKKKKIQNFFKNGNSLGVNIEYIEEKKKMGTIGALSLIKEKFTEPLFVINGDLITNLKFEKMMDFHKKNNSIITMGIKEHEINCAYGEVKLKNEYIHSINEKPSHKFFINTGIYILNPSCIRLIPKKFFDMPNLIDRLISKKKKIISFPLNENWNDIGTPKDYKSINN